MDDQWPGRMATCLTGEVDSVVCGTTCECCLTVCRVELKEVLGVQGGLGMDTVEGPIQMNGCTSYWDSDNRHHWMAMCPQDGFDLIQLLH